MAISDSSENNFSKARFGPSYLSVILKKILKWPVSEFFCHALEGDASDRSYFRVLLRSSVVQENPKSLIVMQLKNPVSELETDFTQTLKFLRGVGIPVPELFHYDVSMGLLFLQDCGTRTLEEHLNAFPETKAPLYHQAVELLFNMQTRATRSIGAKCPAYHLKFDVEKLMWEFNFMLEHYVERLCGSPLTSFDKKEARDAFKPLCEMIANQKQYFTHRDYHSRTLMVDENRLVLIDFQDARMGPCQYDLVSLLKDSYAKINDSLLEELVDFYLRLKEKEEGLEIDREEFYRVFDGMSIQRNLKAVGTFAYHSVKKNNHRYKGYIPPTLEYVRQALNRKHRDSALQEVLLKYIPGLDKNKVVEL